MMHPSYPVGLQGHWQKTKDVHIPDAHLKNWLMDTGSLTERLQANSRQFAVLVLGHAIAPISDEEFAQLYGAATEHSPIKTKQTQVREVLLKGNDQNWVFARSLLPQAFVDDCMQELGTLGNQPLGKILFNDNRFVRSEFELFHCDARHPLCRSLNIEPSKGLWGRRSVFRFQTHRLMVCEVFLPDSPAYRDWETG